MEIYLVGGAVRDTLLNYPVYDRDWVVVGATPEQMLQQGYKPVGKDFPVFIHPDSGEEYALARTERKSGKGYTGFQYHASPDVTLKQDLIRRDLTINAMAMAADKTIIDPYDGQTDLHHKILRHVSPAFAEDPLRVLRVARFLARYHQLGFTIAPETLQLMAKLSDSDELEHLTSERIWQEFQRALTETSPDQFLLSLEQCGALKKLFPELEQTVNDAKTLTALQQPSCAEIRFALLMHRTFADKPVSERASAVTSFCRQYRTPNSFRDLGLQLSCQADQLIGFTTLSAGQRLQLLKDLDLVRRPAKLSPLIQACRILTGKALSAETMIPELLKALQAISPKKMMLKGYQGKALGQAITEAQTAICQQQIDGAL